MKLHATLFLSTRLLACGPVVSPSGTACAQEFRVLPHVPTAPVKKARGSAAGP
jgi:hypothetical protein